MKSIDQLYAFVVVDPEDDAEGIPTFSPSPGIHTPMIGADPDRVMSLRNLAQQVATDMQVPVKVIRFTLREELEIIEPGPAEPAEEIEVNVPEPDPRTVAAWVDGPGVLTEMDVDVREGGVHVFSAVLEGKATVCFQFLTGSEEGPDDVMKPIGLQSPHAEAVGPLAMMAWQTAERALRQQTN